MRAKSSGRFVACVLVGLVTASAGVGQNPVPTDHYGPPSCTADGKPAVASPTRITAQQAIALEEAAAANPAMLPAVTPMENFDIARMRIADYAECIGSGGCYWADIDAQYKRAEASLGQLVATKKHGEKLAIVMDIDETSVSSYCEMQRENYGYIKAMKKPWEVSPDAAVTIPGALRLFTQARAAGVEVFFITGRPQDEYEGTVKVLERAGFKGWKRLDVKRDDEHEVPVGVYKAARRQRIVDEGYRLIMNVGDQWSDLNVAPRAELSVKLTNPFYFLP